jgi:hypothetical protein
VTIVSVYGVIEEDQQAGIRSLLDLGEAISKE